MKPTPTMKAAAAWLDERGGDGVLDRRACIVAAGERGPFAAETWLRLFVSGHIEAAAGRAALTRAGRALADEAG